MFASEIARKKMPMRLDGSLKRIDAGTRSGESMEARGPAAYIAA
jgi:hypothetical protein